MILRARRYRLLQAARLVVVACIGCALLVDAAAAATGQKQKHRAKHASHRHAAAKATSHAAAKATGRATAARDRLTVNFVDADIPSVVKAMSDITGKTIVVDPRVKGTLQVTSPHPVTAKTAYEILLAALRMQGFAAVELDGMVRVVPEADAKLYANAVSKRDGGKRGEMQTRVFDLKHESAAQVLQALRPLVGPQSAMNADTVSNTLVITDYANNLDRLAAVIASLDARSADEPVLIPLKYASAQEVATLIAKLYPTATGGAATQGSAGGEADRMEVAIDARSNSLILRARNSSLVSRVQAMVASLDAPTPAAGNVHVIYLRNAEATKVAETLRRILTADSGAAAAPSTQSAGGNTQRLGAAGGQPHSDGGGAGMVQADAASNALIITAPEASFNSLRTVVEKLDVRRAQVLVEALIAEVSADKASEFGIQWFNASGGQAGSGNKFFGGFGSTSGANIASVAANPLNAATGLSVGLVKGQLQLPGNVTVMNLGLLARFLQTEAKANILSTPTLMTLDNEEAKISVGSNVPFSTGQYTLVGNSATPFQTIQRQDVGLTLRVKPQISEGGTVRLQIYQEVSKLRQPAGSGDTTLATTDKRAIESMVLVDDGQIVVLGGLIEDQVQDNEDKVPVLGDVPVLGSLFRYNTRGHTKTNLMVFLRPHVVRNEAAAASVTYPRYDYILGQQRAAATGPEPMLPALPAPVAEAGNPAPSAAPGTPAPPAEAGRPAAGELEPGR